MAALNGVYIQNAGASSHRLYNGTGAILYQGELTVLGRLVAVANEQVGIAAIGAFDTEDGAIVQATDLETSEDTFATNGQNVYFNPATGQFSDTATVGYFLVGQLVAGGTKDSGGMIIFAKQRWADAIESDET